MARYIRLHRPDPRHRTFGYCSCKQKPNWSVPFDQPNEISGILGLNRKRHLFPEGNSRYTFEYIQEHAILNPPMTVGVASRGKCSQITTPLRKSNDFDQGSENVAQKNNLRPFKLCRFCLDPLSLSNRGDFFWS